VSDLFDEPDDAATPLSPDEKRDLIPSYIAFRSELNLAEQTNIAAGQAWAFARRHPDILNETFIKNLHRRMLGDVWHWAGKFRLSERNIGIDHWEIPAALKILCDDTRAWIEHGSYLPDEIAVRFHHRLVQIHPFPNGNGRHARLMADLLIGRLGGRRFTWGSQSSAEPSQVRKLYVEALQQADRHDIKPLLAFARS
jgi:Fic-DOC domain mobile mystery protein B